MYQTSLALSRGKKQKRRKQVPYFLIESHGSFQYLRVSYQPYHLLHRLSELFPVSSSIGASCSSCPVIIPQHHPVTPASVVEQSARPPWFEAFFFDLRFMLPPSSERSKTVNPALLVPDIPGVLS
ncbi:MAG: hypothetical protein KHX34_02015 [Clostridiales bacterium]|nr:hypothetical protein [Clostridiales bacterium]